jgi:hypothetical protein
MRKLITLSALVTVVVFGWLTSPSSAVPVPADKPVRWEYAELHYVDRGTRGPGGGPRGPGGGDGGQPGQLAPLPQLAIRWITAEEETEAKSWEDLAAKLKAPAAARKDAKEVTHKLRVFNQLGGEGWELVGQQNGEASFLPRTSTWTFKRRMP